MVKISQLFPDDAPTLDDYVPGNDASGPTTKRTLWSAIRDLFFGNIPTTAPGGEFDYVISGGVWTADSAGVNRNASMTAMVCRINGRKISIAAVTGRTFTASKDTYIDVLDNGDGTGTLVYTEATNNAASSALAANSLRVGIIVTGAGSIANAGSINQGEPDKVLPIASSIPYAVTDSLGNLVCPRDHNHTTIGYRQAVATQNINSTSQTDVTGLNATVIVPSGRKVKISAVVHVTSSGGGGLCKVHIIQDGTIINTCQITIASSGAFTLNPSIVKSPSSGSHTYKVAVVLPSATSGTFADGGDWVEYLSIELK